MDQNRLDILTIVLENDYAICQAMQSSVAFAYGIAKKLVRQNNSRFNEDFTDDEVFLAITRVYHDWGSEAES